MEESGNNTARCVDSGYLFGNAGSETPARFAALSTLYDAGTIRRFEALGVREEWHCLEVGGGGGSIAEWLADRVGPKGPVLVTDIDPRFLVTSRLNLKVQAHDIVHDPLPKQVFDLVHARLVLMHLPGRGKALRRMLAALKPGGWFIAEEFDSVSLSTDPSLGSGEVFLKTHVAFSRHLANGGVERRFGRLLLNQLRRHGLADISAEASMSMWQSGSAGVSLMRANYLQARQQMIGAGYITEQEFEEDLLRLDDPDFLMPSPIMWAVCGRRAES
jgi:ubiquinone/menaquinone biosynthesis C-methylase UbiE